MKLYLGTKEQNSSSGRYDCFSCHDSLTIYLNWEEGYGWDEAEKAAIATGWVRRKFHPAANLWFCSAFCAYKSKKAKELQEYWENHAQ